MKKVLVVGGAGYIGSQMTDMLAQSGFEPIVLDSLVTGYEDSVLNAKLIVANLADNDALDKVFSQYKFAAVLHFASFIQVGESAKDPAKYYRNNVVNTLNLLDAMLRHQVNYFIFSSTAAIFGDPQYTPIDEKHPFNPITPYGRSKLMVEQILQDYDRAYGLKSICLRYFNAAGADPATRLGERHNPETHLIPLVLQVASGRREEISVFGDDYATRDGTCVRDYVHIVDLCAAHLLALNALFTGYKSDAFNLGNGQGFTVAEVIKAAGQVTQKSIKVVTAKRRTGDPAVLIADSSRAFRELHWQPQYADLATIIEHAWQWEKKLCG